MPTNDGGPSFFAQYIDAAESKPTPPAIPEPTPPAVIRLLDWLQRDWRRSVICARDLYRHAPAPFRDDRKSALAAAEILEKRGWLIRLPAHRHDRKRWQVTVGPA